MKVDSKLNQTQPVTVKSRTGHLSLLPLCQNGHLCLVLYNTSSVQFHNVVSGFIKFFCTVLGLLGHLDLVMSVVSSSAYVDLSSENFFRSFY